MRINVLVLAACLITVSLFAQNSEVREVGSFKGIKVGQAIDVYLKKGTKEMLKVEVTGTDISNVVTEVFNNDLKIQMKSGNYRGVKSVKVYVIYVDLNKISASSASNVFSEGTIKSGDFEIHASSAANIEISLDARDISVHTSSAADITLEGTAASISAEASSAGEIDAYNLKVNSASANASSAGGIKLNVSESLQAHASSGGDVRYRGNPSKTNTNSSSGGSVKKSN